MSECMVALVSPSLVGVIDCRLKFRCHIYDHKGSHNQFVVFLDYIHDYPKLLYKYTCKI